MSGDEPAIESGSGRAVPNGDAQIDWQAYGSRWVNAGLIDDAQLDAIVAFEAGPEVTAPVDPAREPGSPKRALDLGTITMYVGGFLILFALTIYVGTAWDGLSRGGQFLAALLAVGGLGAVGWWLRYRHSIVTGGNLLIFAATGAVPLLVYTFQRLLGLWSSRTSLAYDDFYARIRPDWIVMEVIAIAVAIAVMMRIRFPLIMLLVAFWGWYLAMDLGRYLMYDESRPFRRTDGELWFGAAVGLIMCAIAVTLYRRGHGRYGMWLGLFGSIALVDYLGWLGLGRDNALASVLLPVTAVALIVASVWLQARVFLVVGAIALYSWVSYLVFTTFEGSSGITFALVFIGLLIVGSGILYQKKVEPWLETVLANHRLWSG